MVICLKADAHCFSKVRSLWRLVGMVFLFLPLAKLVTLVHVIGIAIFASFLASFVRFEGISSFDVLVMILKDYLR